MKRRKGGRKEANNKRFTTCIDHEMPQLLFNIVLNIHYVIV